MTDTMHLGPETPGRPTVRGIVAVKLAGRPEPGFAWCDGPGRSVSLLGETPAHAARMRPLVGGLSPRQVERREVEYWRTYTPPKVPLTDRLREAVAALRGQ